MIFISDITTFLISSRRYFGEIFVSHFDMERWGWSGDSNVENVISCLVKGSDTSNDKI